MSENSFPKAKFLAKGYDPAQVDSFFVSARKAYEGGVPAEKFSARQVRQAHFDLVRGGYQTSVIDQAMDRLEAAFLKRDRADNVAVNGTEAWMDHVAKRAMTLYPRLRRPYGERFSVPKGAKGYDAQEVDQFLDRIALYFDQDEPLSATEVRAVTFKMARGSKAYEEAVVDAYLARMVEVLVGVE